MQPAGLGSGSASARLFPTQASGGSSSASRASPRPLGGGSGRVVAPSTPPRKFASSPDFHTTSFLAGGSSSCASPAAALRHALASGGLSVPAPPLMRSPFAAPGYQAPATFWADR